MNELKFKLISISDIRPEVREIAVAWAEANKYDWIGDKHKLASDIQNYADTFAEDKLNQFIDEQNPSYTKLLGRKSNIILGLNDVLSNSVYTGEEVDVTADKIYKIFVEPLLRLTELNK